MIFNAVPAYYTKERVKGVQSSLNRYGFTDRYDKSLDVDGEWGMRSMQAMDKYNAYRMMHPTPFEKVSQLYGPVKKHISKQYQGSAEVAKSVTMFLADPGNRLFVRDVQQLVQNDLQGILKIFGMHYKPADPANPDDPASDIWYSTKNGIQHLFGYGNSYNLMESLLGFNLKTQTLFFQFEEAWYRFEVWCGLYLMDNLVPGAESGLYYSENRLSRNYKAVPAEKQIGMQVELWSKPDDHLVLEVDSAGTEPDGITYWQFASKPSAGNIKTEDMYIKGRLKSENQAFLEALAATGSSTTINFETPEYDQKSGVYTLAYTCAINEGVKN